jgi:mRNA interferase HigB
MKVHLIKKQTIEDYINSNAQSKSSFEDWLEKLKTAEWQIPGDITATYPSADLLGKGTGRVIFDIAGNHYRMIGKYWFGSTKVHLYIKWIGTHAEYNQLCKNNRQYIIEDH